MFIIAYKIDQLIPTIYNNIHYIIMSILYSYPTCSVIGTYERDAKRIISS